MTHALKRIAAAFVLVLAGAGGAWAMPMGPERPAAGAGAEAAVVGVGGWHHRDWRGGYRKPGRWKGRYGKGWHWKRERARRHHHRKAWRHHKRKAWRHHNRAYRPRHEVWRPYRRPRRGGAVIEGPGIRIGPHGGVVIFGR